MPHLRKLSADPAFFRSRAHAARANKRAQRWFESFGLIAFDLLHRFGALGAAGDRHLCEFVPWYALDEAELHRWGVILTPYSWRLGRVRQADQGVAYYAGKPLAPTDEEGAALIEALAGNAPLDTNVNLPNRGQAPDLPLGHVVETYAHFQRDRASPRLARPLPAGASALVRRVIDVQQLTLRAALERDVELAFQALLLDPLVHLSVDESWTMFKAMLHYLKPHLPGWRLPPGK